MRRVTVAARPAPCVGRLAYGLASLLAVALLLASCATPDEYVDPTAILNRVRQGEDREQALLALSDAWYHSTCNYLDGSVDDVFLYGPRNREWVTVIRVRSVPSGDQLVVELAVPIESYYVDDPNWSTICDPPLPEAFETPRPSTTATP
jgi:hypothetical protein